MQRARVHSFHWSYEEEELLQKAIGAHGKRWKTIQQTYFPQLSTQQLQNKWNNFEASAGLYQANGSIATDEVHLVWPVFKHAGASNRELKQDYPSKITSE